MSVEAQAATPLVDVRGLQVRFPVAGGLRTVVEGLDLRIEAGECVALVGESGSGKSVTARALIDLAGPGAQVQAERFLIDGADARAFAAADWRRLRGTFAGLVMQDALVSLDPLRPIGAEVGEVLTQHRLLRGRAAVRRRVIDTLSQVGMPEPGERLHQHAHELSGGLRQRALIAAAIAAGPRLIIADEPTTALDAALQQQVIGLLAERVRASGAGLLLISHDLSAVAGIADRMIVMRAGRVVESGPTPEVLAWPREAYTRQLIAAVPSASSRGNRLASARFVRDEGSVPPRVRIEREPLPPRQPPAGEPVLRVQGIGKRYRRRGLRAQPAFVALADVSFEVRAGEVLGLVGASGSGKSTCARIVLGLDEPDAGNVQLLGQPWSGRPEPSRRALRPKLQYIPQDPLSSFDPRYCVRDVVTQNLPGLRGEVRDARVRGLLAQVGLAADLLDRLPRTLSGGQRQRLAIARALAAEPQLIVCDEPVSALDVSIQAQVIDLIGELQSRLGTALLFISHDINLVRHVADRVVVLDQGRVVEQGPVDEVLARPAHAYTRSLLAAVPPALVG
ncbi:nickel ABC transporter ATP-binding protein NikE [Pseudacidovorax sp. NFM-22]|uniref:nickel ABC transporter ATP-binding protein NikE n=1 Tax=Pseudacidovorax sp. NFM-22 TaxID=2744469 RepID=UPI001F22FF91|nr:ABC transporter ATP-binding protein [Pseudacidovorax sp. NFM-22]